VAINPIYGPNKLKLGIFCTNGRGTAHTFVPEANKQDWALSLRTARAVDRAGYEAVVPFARWKGYIKEKPNHVSGYCLDTFTWAAGIAASTKHVGIFVTSLATVIHPLVAAKQTATIDAISNGRLAMNVIGGWNRPEMEMFGTPMLEHDQRYDHIEEWVKVLKMAWRSTEEFDHHGQFFDVIRGISIPLPQQQPGPPIMNAGQSGRGMLFACEHADIVFIRVQSDSTEGARAEVDKYKRTAREKFGREVQAWTYAVVVQRETQKEAEDYLEYYAVTKQDRESVDALIDTQMKEVQRNMSVEGMEHLRRSFAAGAGGFPLIGTAEHIAERLHELSDAGVDGVLLSWVDYDDGIERFNRDVLPLLEKSGVRQPFAGI